MSAPSRPHVILTVALASAACAVEDTSADGPRYLLGVEADEIEDALAYYGPADDLQLQATLDAVSLPFDCDERTTLCSVVGEERAQVWTERMLELSLVRTEPEEMEGELDLLLDTLVREAVQEPTSFRVAVDETTIGDSRLRLERTITINHILNRAYGNSHGFYFERDGAGASFLAANADSMLINTVIFKQDLMCWQDPSTGDSGVEAWGAHGHSRDSKMRTNVHDVSVTANIYNPIDWGDESWIVDANGVMWRYCGWVPVLEGCVQAVDPGVNMTSSSPDFFLHWPP